MIAFDESHQRYTAELEIRGFTVKTLRAKRLFQPEKLHFPDPGVKPGASTDVQLPALLEGTIGAKPNPLHPLGPFFQRDSSSTTQGLLHVAFVKGPSDPLTNSKQETPRRV